jgi:hypothetical protein
MPKFLEDKLKAEYGNNPHAIYGTLNKLGAMHGNKETAKGRQMEAKHQRDVKAGTAKPMHPVMRQRAQMVKEAHAHLGQAIPGFHQLPGRQKMMAAQHHVNLRKGKG